MYQDIVEMAVSSSLRDRIAAVAAKEGVPGDPIQWANQRRWQFASMPGWAEDWEYAKNTYSINMNPDMGIRNDVIDDAQLLAAVQQIISEESSPPPSGQ